jgi:hypothetical protein
MGLGGKDSTGKEKDKKLLLDYFKLQKIANLDPNTNNKLVVGKGLDMSILK